MVNWPFWLYRLLFTHRGIDWDWKYKSFRTYGHIMHMAPIDSSFTYCSIYIQFGKWWMYPIVCMAGYQPNAGMLLRLFHFKIFDFTELAKNRLKKREGWL